MPRKRSLGSSSKRRRWRAADARAILAALESSGLSLPAFAAREGLKVERLRRWRQRLGGEKSITTPAFVEVQHRAREPVAIILCSGRVLRVSETIDAEALRRIVDALEDTA